MRPATVRELGAGRLLLDLDFRDTEGLVASYLLPQEDGYTLVETGPTTCLPSLERAVAAAGVDATEVLRIIVTHIHLDHAGGLGASAAAFPRATLFVHERGAPHMIDPTKLIASARRAWGTASDVLWGAIAPVPSERLVRLRGGEALPIVGGALRILATPGHAQHHLSLFDTHLGAILTGDSAGVHLEGAPVARPAIPPPDLDLDLLFTSLDAMAALGPRAIWYSHFGPSAGGAEVFRRYREEVVAWKEAALTAARSDPSVANVARALQATETARAAPEAPGQLARNEMVSGHELAAQGLLRYFRTHGLLPE